MLIRRYDAGLVTIPGHPYLSEQGYGTIDHLVILARERPAELPGESLSTSAQATLATWSEVERLKLTTVDQEVEVQTKPFARLAEWRVHGSRSWCAPVTDPLRGGIRTWIMDPMQNTHSPLPCLQPASAVLTPGKECVVNAETEPLTELALRWHIAFRDQRLIVRHGLCNHGSVSRTVALWSLLIVPQEPGWMCLVAGQAGLEGPWLVKWQAPARIDSPSANTGVVSTPHGVAWRIGADSYPERKIGVKAVDGWTALVPDAADRRDAHGRRLVLLSRITEQPTGTFPEGDLNLTSYRDPDISELEHVGPLVALAPGATTWLEQELRIIALETDPGSDPTAILAAVAESVRIAAGEG